LADCIAASLKIANEISPPIDSISFPAISSGIFGFPKDLCAEIFFKVIAEHAKEGKTNLKHIRLTNFDQPTADVFFKEIQKWKKRF